MRTGPRSLRLEVLAEIYGQRFIDDVVKSMPLVSGIKQLLFWLAEDKGHNSKKLREIFRNEDRGRYSASEKTDILGTGIVEWYRASYDRLMKSTRVQYKRQLLDGFAAMAQIEDRRYPKVVLDAEAFVIRRSRASDNSFEIEQLEKIYGQKLVNDIVKYCSHIYPMRHFLTWLSKEESRSSTDLVTVLANKAPDSISEIQKTGLIVTAIRNWKKASAKKLTPNTLGKYSSFIGFSFEALGRFPNSPYPEYDRRLVPSGERQLGSSTTLGDLNWPEVEHLQGQEKERASLVLLQEGTVSQFQQFYALFKFGQSALTGDVAPDCEDHNSWRTVSNLLKAAHSQILELKTFNYAEIAGDANFSDPKVWIAAGAPPHFFVARNIVKPHDIVLNCLGATGVTTSIAAYALACDTGMNSQPCIDLRRHPFVYLDNETAGIADQGVIDLFKERAGHNVFSYLTRSSPGPRDDLVAIWEKVCGELDHGSEAAFAQHSTIDLLQQYEEMADATRDYDPINSACEKFFVYRTLAGVANLKRFENRWLGGTPYLSRKGVNWRAIRKSFAQITNKDTGSKAATRALMGQHSQGVLASAYLNSAEIIAELEQSTAFFQNVLQALLVRGQLVAIIIKIPSQHIKWFDGLAKISGIESAVGISKEHWESETPSIYFEPTNDRFCELYLIFLAAKLARRTMPLNRWKIQALPLLGVIRALRSSLVHHGLRQAYINAIRPAYHDIKRGNIVIPALLEV